MMEVKGPTTAPNTGQRPPAHSLTRPRSVDDLLNTSDPNTAPVPRAAVLDDLAESEVFVGEWISR